MIGHVNSEQGIVHGKLLVIIVMVAAVGIAIFALFFVRQSPQEQRAITNATGYRAAADQFIGALGRGDSQATFNLMTENCKLEIGGKDKWDELVATSFSKDKSTPEFLSEHDIDDPSGIYKGLQPKLLTYKLPLASVSWETSLTVIQDQGSWKIDRVISSIRQ